MSFSINFQVLYIATFIVSLFFGVQGHSYVTSPQSRSNQAQTETGCRGPLCLGPCDISLSQRAASAAVHVASRGDQITVQWPRNNHAGGFIRFAWAPTSQSDNASYFDEHVQQINCHEVGGCYPDDPSNPNGGDSGPADGSSRACSSNLTIPADLVDGEWTLQWAWFGGAFSLGDYYSCVDYSISGGASGSTPIPVFVGGDYSYPDQQKCKFFNTDRLHVCVNEPCSNPIYPAAQQESGPPAYVQANLVGMLNTSSTSSDSSTSTTDAALYNLVTSGSTTSIPTLPLTTSTVLPMTTGAVPVVTPLTTGAIQEVPAPNPISPPVTLSTTNSGSCISGNMKCLSSNTYSTCNHEVWGPSQACNTGLECSPSGDFIYCIPTSTPTPTTPISTPTTPTTPSTASASSTTSPILSGSCNLGYQQCVASNAYQSCGNGVNGPVWASVQYCREGLSCHPSATANNIYCY